MADTFSKAKRSEVMARIRGKDTQPEIAVRQALHRLGYRFRINVMNLPGRPDIVLAKHRTIIQVKGCFWHSHSCLGGRVPPGRYWRLKFARNKARDQMNDRRLCALGWRVKTVWECTVKRSTEAALRSRLSRLLVPPRAAGRRHGQVAGRSAAGRAGARRRGRHERRHQLADLAERVPPESRRGVAGGRRPDARGHAPRPQTGRSFG